MKCLMCKYDSSESNKKYHPINKKDVGICEGCFKLLKKWKVDYKEVLLLVDDSLPGGRKDEIRTAYQEMCISLNSELTSESRENAISE